MIRRTFLKLLGVAPAFPSIPTAALYWPFVEVPWIVYHDDAGLTPERTSWGAVKHLASCEVCCATYSDDVDKCSSIGADDGIRKFYRATDGSGAEVCEHCAPKYAAELLGDRLAAGG